MTENRVVELLMQIARKYPDRLTRASILYLIGAMKFGFMDEMVATMDDCFAQKLGPQPEQGGEMKARP